MSAIGRKARRAIALPPRDWLTLLEAWAELARVKAELAVDAAATVRDALEKSARASNEATEVPSRMVDLFAIATRNHLYRPTCLPRALVLRRMLERRGLAVKFRIGACKEGNEMRGHAWIEVGGVPVNESADIAQQFAPLSPAEGDAIAWATR